MTYKVKREVESASIPQRWITWHPTFRLDPKFWLEVRKKVPEGKEDDKKFVKKMIKEVEKHGV